jgi:hypothetical protein
MGTKISRVNHIASNLHTQGIFKDDAPRKDKDSIQASVAIDETINKSSESYLFKDEDYNNLKVAQAGDKLARHAAVDDMNIIEEGATFVEGGMMIGLSSEIENDYLLSDSLQFGYNVESITLDSVLNDQQKALLSSYNIPLNPSFQLSAQLSSPRSFINLNLPFLSPLSEIENQENIFEGDEFRTEVLFHMTNLKAGESIRSSKKMFPGHIGKFGAGIYFTEVPEEALRKSLHGNSTLVTCRVKQQKSLVLKKWCPEMNHEFLQNNFQANSVVGDLESFGGREVCIYQSKDVEVLSVDVVEGISDQQFLEVKSKITELILENYDLNCFVGEVSSEMISRKISGLNQLKIDFKEGVWMNVKSTDRKNEELIFGLNSAGDDLEKRLHSQAALVKVAALTAAGSSSTAGLVKSIKAFKIDPVLKKTVNEEEIFLNLVNQ